MNWFLHDRDLRHERVKSVLLNIFQASVYFLFPQKTSGFRIFSRENKSGTLAWVKDKPLPIIDGNGLASLFGTNLRRKYSLYSTLYNFYSVLDMINRNRFFHIFSEDFRTISNMHSLEKTLQECSLKQSSRNGIYIMCLRFQISGTYEEYFYEYS